jgi:hypothetical protein
MPAATSIQNGRASEQAGDDVDYMYHILLSISDTKVDVNRQVEKLRVCGTYTNLKAAKAAAHKVLFEAGYEREWFVEYDTNQNDFEAHHLKHRTGLCVAAKGGDGSSFRVCLATTPNFAKFAPAEEEEYRLHGDLYYVIQTMIDYSEDESGGERESIVEGCFRTYKEARTFALEVALAPDDGVTRESYEQYDEAKVDERDCGYGENVVVHAVGSNGQNILVSVLKGQDLESVRLAEASLRIR